MKLIRSIIMTVTCIGLLVSVSIPSAYGEETVIRFICSTGGSGKAFQGGIKAFNEKFKGKYRVEVEMISRGTLLEKAMMQFVGKTAAFDVLALAQYWLSGVTQYLAPFNDFMAKYGPSDVRERFGGIMSSVAIVDGKVKAFPVRFGTRIIYYRKDWFEEAGITPPETLEEILTTARKLNDWKPGVHGTAYYARAPLYAVVSFGCPFLPLGGEFLTADFKASPSLKSPTAIRVLNFLKTLKDEELVPNPLAWTYDDSLTAFQTGKLAMTWMYSARAMLLENPEQSVAAGKMGYTPFPVSPHGPTPPNYWGSSWYVGIDKNSPHKEAAYRLIEFMTSYETQRDLALNWANGPTNIKVYRDPAYGKVNPAAWSIQRTIFTLPITEFYEVREAPDLEKAIFEQIQDFLLEKQNAEQTTENMYNKIQEIMGGE